MARKKSKNSPLSFKGLGLEPNEDKQLISILKAKELSYANVARKLIRGWIEENK